MVNIAEPVDNQEFLKPQIRAYRKSHFSPAFFFLSSKRKQALETLYAVCRVLDDAVDKGFNQSQAFLDDWARVFETQKADGVEKYGHNTLADRFLSCSRAYGIPMDPMLDLINKGVRLDLSKNRFQTAMDTEDYCYGVAGTVGLACLPIFGVPVEEAKDFAIRLGITVQWINTIRDVGVDAKMGRIYLPMDHLDQFQYREADLMSLKESQAYKELMTYEAQIARAHLKRAEQLLPQKWKKELLPARIMGRIYLNLLKKIEKNQYPLYRKKVKLNTVEKIVATVQELRNK